MIWLAPVCCASDCGWFALVRLRMGKLIAATVTAFFGLVVVSPAIGADTKVGKTSGTAAAALGKDNWHRHKHRKKEHQ